MLETSIIARFTIRTVLTTTQMRQTEHTYRGPTNISFPTEEVHMTVPPATFLELLHAVTSPHPKTREQAAEESTGLIGSYSSRQAQVLAFALASQSSIETGTEALEAELHAIIEIGTAGAIQNEDINPLTTLLGKNLPKNLQEYVNDILESE